MEFPFDIQTEIVKKVDNIIDLHNFCAANKEIKGYCDLHKKEIFKILLKKDNFKNDFFNRFDKLIKIDNKSKKENLPWFEVKKLLRLYPVGEISDNQLLNNLQKDFINVFYNLTPNDILLYQSNLRNIFLLLFFPSEHTINVLIQANELLKMDHFLREFIYYKYANKLIYIYIYHLEKIKKIDKKMYYELQYDLIKDIFSEMDDEVIDFFENAINILQKELKIPSNVIGNIIGT